ncbi:MAG: endonuclease III [Candidatus Tectomicrobia bacterium]|uniref:Endonuclease III n=1 Tax=Tectimicrobiota bacterium TaxID=2528274 RepID=A0A937VYP2_UNCTE|nr:endonuclease III [Candidatus Tectomicrobia bacterium]
MAARRVSRHLKSLLTLLQDAYPDAHCALDFTTPLELLIATILSAQCTDARVNQVTPALFRTYQTAAAYAAADPEVLARDIQSTGFYRQKAKAIQQCCTLLVAQHDGTVPETMEALVALPGVGRKTANVVLGNAFQRPAGIAVDTHVQRVSRRIGLTVETTPEKIERELLAVIPQRDWTHISHVLITHGRTVCKARVPQCSACVIHHLCPSAHEGGQVSPLSPSGPPYE